MKRTGEKGIEGRSGGEQRKERGAKVRVRVEERDGEERREGRQWTLSEPPFPPTFRLTPGLFFGVCEQQGGGNEYETGSSGSSARLV